MTGILLNKPKSCCGPRGAKIEHSPTGGAYYNFLQDTIRLPSPERFATPNAYYATALHELSHWTALPDRLDRDVRNPFGSQAYAREELRAPRGIGAVVEGAETRTAFDLDSVYTLAVLA